jgi:hypothetical protein
MMFQYVPVGAQFIRGESIFRREPSGKGICVASGHDSDVVGKEYEFGSAVDVQLRFPSSVYFESNFKRLDPSKDRKENRTPAHATTQLQFANGWTVSLLCRFTGTTEVMAFRTSDKTAFDLEERPCNAECAAKYIAMVAALPDTSIKTKHPALEWQGNVARIASQYIRGCMK